MDRSSPLGSPSRRAEGDGLDLTPLLLIEDDDTIGRNLQTGLNAHGYRTDWARTASAGLSSARSDPPGVLLLDLGLPDLDGVEVARLMRAEHPDLLIVMLTARSDDLDVIIGLDAGADDYLTKPFTLAVLLARLRAHLRTRIQDQTESSSLQVGELTIDLASRRCSYAGNHVDLRPKEFDLLSALARKPGEAVTREDLMSQVWDENWFGSTKTLDVTMAALRRRLTESASSVSDANTATLRPVITTLRGHGYRLEHQGRTASTWKS
ncbi:MAG: response regulator transcription factor [Nocardioides sp.]